MKKTILFLFLSFNAYGQIEFTTFPKIGFGDMFALMNAPLYYSNVPQWWPEYESRQFYYPELRDLGLNYVVTFGGNYQTDDIPPIPIPARSLDPTYNSNLKVLDFYFVSRLFRYDPLDPTKQFFGSVYAGAQGNTFDRFPYQVGGDIAGYEDDGNFGFGTATRTSAWITAVPPAIGVSDFDPLDLTKEVFYQTASPSHSPGLLLEATLPEWHQARTPAVTSWNPERIQYTLILNARIDGYTNSGDMTPVATVRIFETPDPPTPISKPYSRNHPHYAPYDIATASSLPLDISYVLYVKDFGGDSYLDLPSPLFNKNTGKDRELHITVEWHNNKSLYIDHFYIYDNYYESLFIASDPTATYDGIKSQMHNIFDPFIYNALYGHFYMDEPWPNAYRSVKKISDLSHEAFPLKTNYVSGAVGDYANRMLKYGNSQGRLPYIMTDKYPFWWIVNALSTDDVQNALNHLINTVGTDNTSTGLVYSIDIAHNFTPETTDDVPLVCAIQVQAEKRLVNGVVPSPTDDYYMRFRAPTPNEIKVQGFLSICYGAKGLAYYTVNTQTESNTDNEVPEMLSTYGLFEQSGNAYRDDLSGGLVQDPHSDQVTNSRFTAVKELNATIDKIGAELLNLTWQGAKSWHNGGHTENWSGKVSNVSTNVSGETKYIETGHFVNAGGTNYLFTVNRRTLTGESRNVTCTMALSSGYWKISDVSSSNAWYIEYNGSFTDALNPGEGKLYKIESVSYRDYLTGLASQGKSDYYAATSYSNSHVIEKDDSGNLHSVFMSGGEIFYRRSTDGGSTWDIISWISGGNGSNAAPCIAIGPDASLHVVWQRSNGSNYDLWNALSTNLGSSWTTSTLLYPTPVAGSYTGQGLNPVILGMNGSQRKLLCVWAQSNGLHYKTSNSTTSWSGEEGIVPGTQYNGWVQHPSLASFGSSLTATTVIYDDGNNVYSNRYDADANTWSSRATAGSGYYDRLSSISYGWYGHMYGFWSVFNGSRYVVRCRYGYAPSNSWNAWQWDRPAPNGLHSFYPSGSWWSDTESGSEHLLLV